MAYNTLSGLSVTGGPGSEALGLSVGLGHQGNAGLSMDQFEQEMPFDETLLDNVNGLSFPLNTSYEFENFASSFEDPFTYTGAAAGRAYSMPQHSSEGFHETLSPQEELDNKLLGFSTSIVSAVVRDESGQLTEPTMSAELFGMFFMAEDVYSTENTARPLELTCYRRNLWWCSGQVTLPRQVTHIVTEGRQVPVLELAASITAMESIEGKATEIICIPWKSTAANAGSGAGGAAATAAAVAAAQGDDNKVAGSPPNVPIDLANGQELENGRVSVPVSWKRLQFKHATANNGRRKGQQQHYVVQINLLGRVQPGSGLSSVIPADKTKAGAAVPVPSDNGEWVKIAELQSGPVIVRGRSPRNFVSRRDVPLTGGSTTVDKSKIQQQQQQQQQQHQQQQHQQQQHQQQQQQQQQHQQQQQMQTHLSAGLDMTTMHPLGRTNSSGLDMTHNFQRYNLMGGLQQPQHSEWTAPYAHPQPNPHPAKKLAVSPSQPRPPVPTWDTSPSKSVKTAPVPAQLSQQSQQKQAYAYIQQKQQQQQQQQQKQKQQARSGSVAMPLNLSEDERSPSNRLGSERASNSPPFSSSSTAVGHGGGSTSGVGSGVSLALPSLAPSAASAARTSSSSSAFAARYHSDAFENGEMLYEYFPLSLDDWMPPVDAIYRPHVVHHTVVPPEVKAQQIRSKTKRYFAAE